MQKNGKLFTLLQFYRLKRGLTITDLEHKSRINAAYISLFERGKKVPTEEELSMLSYVLGIRPKEVLLREAEIDPASVVPNPV